MQKTLKILMYDGNYSATYTLYITMWKYNLTHYLPI